MRFLLFVIDTLLKYHKISAAFAASVAKQALPELHTIIIHFKEN